MDMKPKAIEDARMNRSLLVHAMRPRTRIPATAIVLYRKTCIPPSTDGGIDAKMAPNFAMILEWSVTYDLEKLEYILTHPISIKIADAAQPALLLAQLVKTITPLLPA